MIRTYQGFTLHVYRPSAFTEIYDGVVQGPEDMLFRFSANAGSKDFGMLLGIMSFGGRIEDISRYMSKDGKRAIYVLICNVMASHMSDSEQVIAIFRGNGSGGVSETYEVVFLTGRKVDYDKMLVAMNDNIEPHRMA